ncbi:MAG TPA: hypothetical protein VGV09_11615 [Steroidobacteraceae bacterium]|nr:hypothetical protein [Steroidobacteraceae bacterium]
MRRHGPGALVLFAAPTAWLTEISVGYALASGPCFAADRRLLVPAAQWAWSHTGLYVLAVAAIVVAIYAFTASVGALRQVANAAASTIGADHRVKFAALWGIALSSGFGVATLLTGVGLVLLPRCGG